MKVDLASLIESKEFIRMGKKTTICLMTLKDGFELVTSSACAKEEEFDKDIGEATSYRLALEKLYEMLVVASHLDIKNLFKKSNVKLEG